MTDVADSKEDRGESHAAVNLSLLLGAQEALRARFDDFRGALDRRDEEAYRLALTDFHACLVRWTQAEETALLPAVLRAGISGRDPQRELRLEWVQLRELTRHVLAQITERAPLADILGYVENLQRRLSAHETEMRNVYFPAAAPGLSPDERTALERAAPTT